MISPQVFAEKTGISYNQTLTMCKTGELKAIKTDGGHFKVYDFEVDRFVKKKDFISRESYEKVLRENERFRTMIAQLKILVNGFTEKVN